MSTRHREQFADVGNGGELRFGEHRRKLRAMAREHVKQRGLHLWLTS